MLKKETRFMARKSLAKRPKARRSLKIESLEDRRLLSATTSPTVNVSPLEQLTIELINRARANPAAEAARHLPGGLNSGIAANSITTAPKPPLAPNQLLSNVAAAHSTEMLQYGFEGHDSRNGRTPPQRMTAAGYSHVAWRENIGRAWQSGTVNPVSLTQQIHSGLIKSTRGHRQSIFDPNMVEIGVGARRGSFRGQSSVMVTEDFGRRTGDNFLTGVAFVENLTKDNFYTVRWVGGQYKHEGKSGVKIRAVNALSGAAFETVTGQSGGYSLRLPNGSYVVTASGGGINTTTVTDVNIQGQNSKLDFGNHTRNTISGQVFNDLNSNGSRGTGELGLANWTVYVDINNNGKRDAGEPTSLTNSSGNYSIPNLAVGTTYRIGLDIKSGWQLTSQPGVHSVSLTAGQVVGNRNFGIRQPTGSVSGLVFHDFDRNGTMASNEPGLSSWRVYVDANNNGKRDAGELSVLTSASGSYQLSGLAPGSHRIRAEVPSTWEQITPTALHQVTVGGNESIQGKSFGVRDRSGNLSLVGTSGFDSFIFTAGPSPTVRFNGVLYAFSSSSVNVNFDGRGGGDSVELHGGAGTDTATLNPGRARLSGTGYQVNASNVKNVKVFSGGGTADQAFFYDSAGNDSFHGRNHLNQSVMTGSGYENFVSGFSRVFAYSNAGGSDTALFYDTSGDDKFVTDVKARQAYLSGGGIMNHASGFANNTAYSTAGGNDLAVFHDSQGNDLFHGRGQLARLTSGALLSQARNFKRVNLGGNNGGTNRLDVGTVDFLFSSTGSWIS